MPDRTLAQAVADLRLSDTRLRQDLQQARILLLNAAQDIERQLRIEVAVELDAAGINAQFDAITEQIIANTPTIDIPMEADPQGLQASVDAVSDQLGAVTFPVQADTSEARGQLIRLQQDVAQAVVGIPVDINQTSIDDIARVPEEQLVPRFAEAGDIAGAQFGSRLGLTLQRILATSALTLGGFLATSLFKGFQRLTTIEDATASLTVALQSATKAAEVLDDVLGVVRGTPFNLDQFAEAASNMISFGIAAEKVPGYLTAIGEAAASKGGRANEFAQRLSLVFGQIAVQGRITNEEIQSLQLTGVDALKILGNQAGVTAFEMRELISRGVVPADEALDTLAEGILNGSTGVNGATVAFAGTMNRLRETLTGAIGGFGAATARFGASIIRPLQETLTVGFNAASQALDVFGGKVEGVLGGLADSPGVQRFQELLEDLPELATGLVEQLQGLGPALAPLATIFAGLGGAALAPALGPLGRLLPQITSLTGAATVGLGVLIATVPELREAALPVLVELGETVAEVAVILGPALSDAVEAAIPIVRQLIEVFGDLQPIIRNIAAVGAGAIAGVAAGLEAIGDVLDKIPTPVITSIVGLIAAFKGADALKAPFRGLVDQLRSIQDAQRYVDRNIGDTVQAQRNLELTRDKASNTAVAMNQMGISAERMSKAVGTAAVSVAAGFSGMALAAEDTSTQITGLVGSLGSIAAGFAVGGPWGGALTIGATALGYLAGGFLDAKREAAQLQTQVEGVAESIVEDLVDGVDQWREALDNFDAESFRIADAQAAVKQFTDDLPEELLLQLKALEPVGFGMSDLLRVDDESIKPARDLVERLADDVRDLETLSLDLEAIQFPGFGEDIRPSGFLDPSIVEKLPLPQGISFGNAQEVVEAYNETLQDQIDIRRELIGLDIPIAQIESTDPDSAKVLDNVVALLDERNRFETEYQRILDIQKAAIAVVRQEEDTRIREALQGLGLQGSALDDIIAKARELGEEDPVKWYKGIQGILEGAPGDIGEIESSVDGVTEATEKAEEALKAWEEAVRGIAAAFDGIGSQLDSIRTRADALNEIRSITSGLNEIVNEQELREAERLADQIDSQYERVETAKERLRDAARDFQFDEQIALERIAEAEAVGATRGAAGLRRDLERDRQKVIDLQNDVAAEEQKLAELQAEREAISTLPLTLGQVLRDQAAAEGITLTELLISQPTEESQAAFRQFVEGPIDIALADVADVLERKGPEAALAVAERYRDLLGEQFTAAFGEGTGADLSGLFDLEDISLRVTALAFATDFAELVQGGLDSGEKLTIRTTLEDYAFTADQLAAFEGYVEAINPKAVFGVEFDDIQAAIDEALAQTVAVLQISTQIVSQDPVTGQLVQRISPTSSNTFFADGGLVSFFRDGALGTDRRPRGRENHVAHIARDSIRVFAEPETGGEGYIPLAPSKRPRSERILRDIAQLFGLAVVSQRELVEPTVAAQLDLSGADLTFTAAHGAREVSVRSDAVRELREVARHATSEIVRDLTASHDRTMMDRSVESTTLDARHELVREVRDARLVTDLTREASRQLIERDVPWASPSNVFSPDLRVNVAPAAVTIPAPLIGAPNHHALADAVGKAVASALATQRRYDIGERYDRAVHIDRMYVGRDPSDRKLARRVVHDLADLSLRIR